MILKGAATPEAGHAAHRAHAQTERGAKMRHSQHFLSTVDSRTSEPQSPPYRQTGSREVAGGQAIVCAFERWAGGLAYSCVHRG